MGDLIALVYAALWIVAANSDKPAFTTAVHEVVGGFSSAIASWNVSTSGDAWIGVQMRARVGDRWTRWYDMGHWSSALDDGHRHSIDKQTDADGEVDTDTLNLIHPATAVQVRADLHPSSAGTMPQLRMLAVTTDSGAQASQSDAMAADVGAWGTDIDVPQLTQRVGSRGGAYGGGGGSWCSPTSVAMVMGYWAHKLDKPQWVVDVPTAAKGTYDPVYDGCGNWPFNVAYASEHGLAGYIERLSSLAQVERLVKRGIPVIASIKVAQGELDGTPYGTTDGHLLVVRGFTADGDIIVNEPDGDLGAIRRIYKRAQFAHVWQHGSHGAVYIIAPPQDLPHQPI
ncbi:MAG: peptidase C39 family protein [Candidatus Eremiobacterales bacterium]